MLTSPGNSSICFICVHCAAGSSKLETKPRRALRRTLLDASAGTATATSSTSGSSSSSSSSADAQHQEDQGAVDYAGVEEKAGSAPNTAAEEGAAAGGEVPQYPAAAFDLPAAAAQAAQQQVQELQQMLAAQRVPRVHIEKVGQMDW
jgi:hypothetical protein